MMTPSHAVVEKLALEETGEGRSLHFPGEGEGVPDCVQVLLQHKADLSSVDAWDRTPLQVVLQQRRAGIHFAEQAKTRVIELAEQCVEIMGAEARASMPSRDAEAATELTRPWCQRCMRSRSCVAIQFEGQGCIACVTSKLEAWCAQ